MHRAHRPQTGRACPRRVPHHAHNGPDGAYVNITEGKIKTKLRSSSKVPVEVVASSVRPHEQVVGFSRPRLCFFAVFPFSPLHLRHTHSQPTAVEMLISTTVQVEGAVCAGVLIGAPAFVQQWVTSDRGPRKRVPSPHCFGSSRIHKIDDGRVEFRTFPQNPNMRPEKAGR